MVSLIESFKFPILAFSNTPTRKTSINHPFLAIASILGLSFCELIRQFLGPKSCTEGASYPISGNDITATCGSRVASPTTRRNARRARSQGVYIWMTTYGRGSGDDGRSSYVLRRGLPVLGLLNPSRSSSAIATLPRASASSSGIMRLACLPTRSNLTRAFAPARHPWPESRVLYRGLLCHGRTHHLRRTPHDTFSSLFLNSAFRKVYSTRCVHSPAATGQSRPGKTWSLAGLVAVFGASAVSVHLNSDRSETLAEAPPDYDEQKGGPEATCRKFFRLAEVAHHGATSERPWVIKGTGVYDITDWIISHPGGKVILRAAGSAVEPYWDIFTIHKKEDVYQILEQYRIGDVDPRDLVDGQVPKDSIDDPFRDDPQRSPRLIFLTERPCNAESPPSALSSFITETPVFYVRHHFWVPRIDEASYQLTIDVGDGSDEKTYTLSDLRTKFPQHTITAVLQCSGNRRAHMNEGAGREASGLKWDVGAISNAEWRGPLLRDVLRDAGLDLDQPGESLRHAQFLGEDAYGASIPLEKAIDPRGDVLLACEMNGETLPPDHGYPVRVVVPGNTGARSVKWVNQVTLAEDESPSQWQRRDYKCFGPNETRDKVNWDEAPAIQETPVQSAITAIRRDKDTRDLDSLVVEGYAFSGGGRRIIRVDVSVDNGQTWEQAHIEPHKSRGHRAWSWSLWNYRCPRPPAGSQVIVKAIDETYNTQPDTYGPTWNFRGNLTNSWHRVHIDDSTLDDTQRK